MTKYMNRYLILCPRGLEWVLQERLQNDIQHLSVATLEATYHVEFQVVGSTAASSQYGQEIRNKLLSSTEYSVVGHKRLRRQDCISGTCRLPVGTVKEEGGCYGSQQLSSQDRFVSVGYSANHDAIWTTVGNVSGTVWLELRTNAPLIFLQSLRYVGPLLALVQSYSKCRTGTEDERVSLTLSESQTLPQITDEIRRLISGDSNYVTSFGAALNLWTEFVETTWDLPVNPSQLRYRLSCLRNDSKNYKFTRQELLAAINDIVVPTSMAQDGTQDTTLCSKRQWTVDLCNYDLEIVIFIRSDTSLVIGFSLRPYRQNNAKSFAAGQVPPDLSAPYNNLSSLGETTISSSTTTLSDVIRLRPSTAQLLLHLAGLQPGDIVLDPCCGVGTIPIESLLGTLTSTLSLGGDLILTPNILGPFVATLHKQARDLQTNNSSTANFLAWDACQLPLRNESIDVIVSDLPFGHSCLSSSKLHGLLPLMLVEMARVLRKSGRMILLCGSPVPILELLQQQQEHQCNLPTTSNHNKLNTSASLSIWQFPCTDVFPVNIGGLLAWIIQVQRGTDTIHPLPRHCERWRKIVAKRERTARHEQHSKRHNEHGDRKKSHRLKNGN